MYDQEAAVNWVRQQADRCGKCGTAPWEWEENLSAYQARTFQCLGCLKLDNAHADLRQRKSSAGMHVDLVRSS